VEVKPSYGLTDEQVEAMISESIEHAEEDFRTRQVLEARVEADAILAAVEKAQESDIYWKLKEKERQEIAGTVNQLLMFYHADDHLVIRAAIQEVNRATLKLAEKMMNRAVRATLKGSKIDDVG
jgi:molecular chaperone DnaK (HSP70)